MSGCPHTVGFKNDGFDAYNKTNQIKSNALNFFPLSCVLALTRCSFYGRPTDEASKLTKEAAGSLGQGPRRQNKSEHYTR